MTSLTGTIAYLAPEMIDDVDEVEYNHKIDIWALGVTLYYLACRKLPVSCVNHGGVVWQEME